MKLALVAVTVTFGVIAGIILLNNQAMQANAQEMYWPNASKCSGNVTSPMQANVISGNV
jgi:hypothetical protein